MSRFYYWNHNTKTWIRTTRKRYRILERVDPLTMPGRIRIARIDPPVDVPTVKTRQVVVVVYPNGWACVKTNEGALFNLYQTSTRDQKWRTRVGAWCHERDMEILKWIQK